MKNKTFQIKFDFIKNNNLLDKKIIASLNVLIDIKLFWLATNSLKNKKAGYLFFSYAKY